jgi:hypothetical protein
LPNGVKSAGEVKVTQAESGIEEDTLQAELMKAIKKYRSKTCM